MTKEYKTPRIGRIKVRTIDIHAKEWFDKVNGNSYFAAHVTLNYGLPGETTFNIPFKYGYGDYYVQASTKMLQEKGVIKTIDNNKTFVSLRQMCHEHGIVLRASKSEAKQKEVKEWGNP